MYLIAYKTKECFEFTIYNMSFWIATRANISIVTLRLSLLDNNEICAAAVFHMVPLCHIITACIVSPLGLFKLINIHMKTNCMPLESTPLLEYL